MTTRMRHLRHRELDGLARSRLDHLQSELSRGVVPSSFDTDSFTSDFTQTAIILGGYDDGEIHRVVLFPHANSTLPNGLTAGIIYWLGFLGQSRTVYSTKETAVISSTADFQYGYISFTDNGTGTFSLAYLDGAPLPS